MANARPPGGDTPRATIGYDFSSLRDAPNVVRELARAAARAATEEFRQAQREQAAAEKQRVAEMQAALTQRRVAVRAAAREETQAQREAQREQAAAEKQRMAAMQAALTQRRVAVKAALREEVEAARAAKREEVEIERAAAAQRQSIRQGVASFVGAAFGGPIGGIAGAVAGGGAAGIGLAAGLAVSQGARAAIDATRLATAYDRQRVAAVNLAGSQRQLNQLLAVYERATGGAVSRAQALQDVTKLMSVGFADNSKELDQFARAIRGISIAMGTSQDTVTQNLILELFSQRGQRLDQLGLQYDKVRRRADELRATDASLTQQQAYQNAVLEQANDRFGKLADSAQGAATGIEKAQTAWENFQLVTGQAAQANVNDAGGLWAGILNTISRSIEESRRSGAERNRATQEFLNNFGIGAQGPQFAGGVPSWMTSATPNANPSRIPSRFDPDQVAALRRADEGFAAIERDATKARLDETASYERQRAQIISDYAKQTTREAEDFGRQRLYAERKFAMSILDVAQDSARQRVKWEEDTARAIAEARAERDERIAELRADSAERIGQIEEKFAKDQQKRARDHAKNLREAAASLDAVAIREEQRRFREENEEAKAARDEQVSDARDALAKSIDEQNKAFAKQERQQTESLQRRIAEQAENDRLRIEEMREAFEDQKAQEDEERAIRLSRQAEDHNAQLIELERQHGERIQQIKDDAQKERDQFTEESNKFLEEVGIHNQAWLDEQEAINQGVIKLHGDLLDEQRRALLNPGHPSLADPYVNRENPYPYVPSVAPSTGVTNTRASTVNIQPGAITIVPPANANYALDDRFAAFIMGVIADFFEGHPQ